MKSVKIIKRSYSQELIITKIQCHASDFHFLFPDVQSFQQVLITVIQGATDFPDATVSLLIILCVLLYHHLTKPQHWAVLFLKQKSENMIHKYVKTKTKKIKDSKM